MTIKAALIKKILKRNNFIIEQNDDKSYFITQENASSFVVNLNYFLAFGLVGIFLLLLLSGSLLGVFFLFVSIPIFIKIHKSRSKQISDFGAELIVNKDFLELSKEGEVYKIESGSIKEVTYEVEKGEEFSIGKVSILTNNGEWLQILELLGDELSVVDDDAGLIAQFISNVFNSE